MTKPRIIARMRSVPDSRDLPAVPSRMLGRVMDMLRHKFSNPDNVFRDELRDIVYKDDPETTGIMIVTGFDGDPSADKENVFPRLVVTPGSFNVVEEMSPLTHGALTNTLMDDDIIHSQTYMATLAGDTTISAASRNGLESLILAEDSMLWLLTMKEDMRKKLRLSKFDVTLLEGPKKNEGVPASWYTVLKVSWASSIMWDIIPDGLPIGDFGAIQTSMR